MKTQNKAYPIKQLIVMTATGTLDLDASKAALKSLSADPDFNVRCEVLLDLRDVECFMSEFELFELAKHMTFPDLALPTLKRIALLVDGQVAFNHAHFLELCTQSRGLNVHAFEDYETANEWLNAELPQDPKGIGSTPETPS
jgi:hypothetical protein